MKVGRLKLTHCTLALCLTLVLLLSGCVFRQEAFRHSGFFLQMRLESTFNLSAQQKNFARQEIDLFLSDLSKREIPSLQNLITDASSQLRPGITVDEVEVFFDRWDVIYSSAVLRASAPVGFFLSGLKPEQIAGLKVVHQKSRKKIIDSLSKGEQEFIKKNKRKIADRISDWIGTLSEKQLAVVSVFAQQEFAFKKREVVAQERSQERLYKALLDGQGAQRLAELFVQQQSSPFAQLDPEHSALRRERRRQWAKLISELAQSLTTEQKEVFKRETKSLSFDLALLPSGK